MVGNDFSFFLPILIQHQSVDGFRSGSGPSGSAQLRIILNQEYREKVYNVGKKKETVNVMCRNAG
jgi:hypothetical protein